MALNKADIHRLYSEFMASGYPVSQALITGLSAAVAYDVIDECETLDIELNHDLWIDIYTVMKVEDRLNDLDKSNNVLHDGDLRLSIQDRPYPHWRYIPGVGGVHTLRNLLLWLAIRERLPRQAAIKEICTVYGVDDLQVIVDTTVTESRHEIMDGFSPWINVYLGTRDVAEGQDRGWDKYAIAYRCLLHKDPVISEYTSLLPLVHAKLVMDPCNHDAEAIEEVLEFIRQYGSIDGDHHKTWVLDNIVRIFALDRYDDWVRETRRGEDGPTTYDWDTGIAP